MVKTANKGQKGQMGIVIIFFVLTVLGAISVSFLYRMKLEQEATSNYCDAVVAEYLAWAGIEKAIAELKNDDNHYDDLYEKWARGFRKKLGAGYYDVQLISDNGKIKEVGIVDEASRLNINVAGGSFNQGCTPFELTLDALEGVGKDKSRSILKYRYGPDGAPGKSRVDDDGDADILSSDGIDNDADGKTDEKGEGVDEPGEFCPDSPSGDDNPFETVGEIRLVPGIGEYTFNETEDNITIYSYDKNIDREGRLRVNINHAPSPKIAQALKRSGFSEGKAAQIAVNIVDFRDEDNNPTQYRGKYGIERTPYINEVMPNFTTSAMAAVTDLVKGGVKYLKHRAKREVKKKIEEKIKGEVPQLDKILDEIGSVGEKKLQEEVDRIIDKYKRGRGAKRGKDKSPVFALFGAKPAFAKGSSSVKVDIQIEWVELFNPYSSFCPPLRWKIKTSLGKRRILGAVPARGYWVVFNVVIKMPGKTFGKELLDNFADTVQLLNKNGKVVDEVSYHNYGFPWRAWEKNDPRMREFAGCIPGGSPWFRNWYWMPRVGEVSPEQTPSSFYVKNRPFACVGETGYIHSGTQWRTINLDKGGDWQLLDAVTTAWPVEKPVKGKVNINTASKQVLKSLPGIDSKTAGQIISYCDSKKGPFDEIGEIAEVRGMQKLGINGFDDDGDGYVDEDDEKEVILKGISNLITVRSMCFTVVSLGKVIRGGREVAEKKIKVVVDRGTSPVRISYYREIHTE